MLDAIGVPRNEDLFAPIPEALRLKTPLALPEPLAEAVDQLRRYTNQRRASGEVEDNEGNERLFHTNQLLIATSFDEARVGSVGAAFRHYAAWNTVVGADGGTARAAALGKPSSPSRSGWWPACRARRTCWTWCGTMLFMAADGNG
jgi:hypothetical protein